MRRALPVSLTTTISAYAAQHKALQSIVLRLLHSVFLSSTNILQGNSNNVCIGHPNKLAEV